MKKFKKSVSILLPYGIIEMLIEEKNRRQTTLSQVIIEAVEAHYEGKE